MKKTIKRVSVLMMVVMALCLLATSLVACHKPKHDSESRAFSMSLNVPDGVFNPFYSSSADDSSVISLTQIAMLNTDKLGNIVCGENEPTVTKSWWSNENKDDDGNVVTTTYEFLIKNGIKWSNGSDLTIKDVLFNLYVYLDPAYTGSATIYSTDIVGLNRYRSQSDDGDSSDFEAGFIQDAALRINNAIEYVQAKGKGVSSDNRPTLPDNLDTTQIVSDFVTIARLFYRELESDWNAINIEDYKEWGNVTSETANLPAKDQKFDGIKDKWVIFFLNDGGYSQLLRKDKDENYAENSKGNYIIDAEAREEILYTMAQEWLVEKGLATIDEQTYAVTLNNSDASKLEEAIKEYCITTVFSNYFPGFLDNDANASIITKNVDKFELTNAERTEVLNNIIPNTNANQYEMVSRYWGSASTALEQFTAEEKSAYFQTAERIAPNIEGIKVSKTNNFHGEALGSTHYVLRIDINDVDPKAIYNFSFTVAPMYYYSTTDWSNAKANISHRNYIKEMSDDFDAWEAAYDRGENYTMSHFGLEFGSNDFMLEVVKPESKNGVPVGGGPYMASSESGKESGVTKADFLNNNMIYYVRNPYFNTVGAQIENAKIKYVRYKVVDADQIVNYLTTGNLDFGDPSATQANIDVLNGAGINHVEIKTNGYGYVGINPRYVPEVAVRRIIMSAMNTQLIVDDYYEGGLAELIKRPISKTSWAYPQSATDYVAENGFEYRFNQSNSYSGQTIEQILEGLGYTRGSGNVYEKNIDGFGRDRLDYKFTIAGGSTDHPAYAMFLEAVGYLNKHGFGVQVVTSQQALSDLSNGKLAVWAAAWSSTIDPDMYQVYHKDSQASSVKNWGYPQILGMTSDAAWGDELVLVQQLSEQIDLGRATTDQDKRKEIYAGALNIIMELAVECPTYQRNDMSAYQPNLLDPKTLPSKDDCSPYSGLLARIWEIDYL
ncbi:MAG: hypothetical protein HDT36_01505 [Clostridiales bacterium]|nr:hypothetical protein [Clostridiales bacterium]